MCSMCYSDFLCYDFDSQVDIMLALQCLPRFSSTSGPPAQCFLDVDGDSKPDIKVHAYVIIIIYTQCPGNHLTAPQT